MSTYWNLLDQEVTTLATTRSEFFHNLGAWEREKKDYELYFPSDPRVNDKAIIRYDTLLERGSQSAGRTSTESGRGFGPIITVRV